MWSPIWKKFFQGQQILPMSAIFEPTKNRNPYPLEELAEDSDHFNKTRNSVIKYNATRNILPPANEVWGKVMFSQVSVILSTRGSVSRGSAFGRWADFPPPPPHWILRDTVNERAVRILLECILVLTYI